MNPILWHELVGIDAQGKTCSCGDRSSDWLEHLGSVAQLSSGLTPKPIPVRVQPIDFDAEDDAWYAAQQREHNLRTYQIQPPEKRPVKKRPKFTPEQLAIALGVLDKRITTSIKQTKEAA